MVVEHFCSLRDRQDTYLHKNLALAGEIGYVLAQACLGERFFQNVMPGGPQKKVIRVQLAKNSRKFST